MKQLRNEAANLGQQISQLNEKAGKTKDRLKKKELELHVEQLTKKRKELLRYIRTGTPAGYAYVPVPLPIPEAAKIQPKESIPDEAMIEEALPASQNLFKRFLGKVKATLKWKRKS